MASARTLGFALVGAVVLAYARLWWAGFIWDDDEYVINNPCLRSLVGLGQIWFVPGSTPQYYPLTHTSFWIEYHLWGLTAPFYHFVNVLLHAANAVLLWVVLHRLGVPAPWLGAALFALHPVEVETVAWITERKNTLSAFFGLLFMLAWLRYRFGDNPLLGPDGSATAAEKSAPSLRWLAIATAFFLASLLCKTVTITLVGVVLVISWWKTGRISRADVVGIAPLLLIGLPLAFTTVIMEKTTVGAVGEEWALSPADRIVLAGRVIVFYLSKLVWPQPLIFFYPRWTISATQAWQWSFPIGVAATVYLLWGARKQIGRGPLAAALLFVGMLFPALGFFDVYPFQYSFVADHFQYHASAAALAGLGAAAWLAAGRLTDLRLRTLVVTGWLFVLTVITAAQTRPYLSLEHLYGHVLAHNPSSYVAANNLAMVYAFNNRFDKASELFAVAAANAQSTRQKARALRNSAQAALRRDDLPTALVQSREAYELMPTSVSRSLLTLALARAGSIDDAARLLANTSEDHDEPGASHPDALDLNRLAHAEVAMARNDGHAASHYLQLLLVETHNEWMLLQAGRHFAQLGVEDQAAKAFGTLTKSTTCAASAFSALGELAIEGGNLEVAEACFRAAIGKDPSFIDAHVRLARILNWHARHVDAEVVLIKALRANPDDPQLVAELSMMRFAPAAAPPQPPS